ncbi:hypothetical protein F5146DRAFT_1044530 [Armillaria mellea]|nr:hypothetical protein F5146DRAFT_1044530 [Armillaria mellea]
MEGWSKRYVDPRKVAKSYRPKAGAMSPGLKRAREPFRIPNALTGFVLGAFAVGVYSYSIYAVKQDEFEDLDDEVKSRATSLARMNAGHLTEEEEKGLMDAAITKVATTKK